MRITSKKICDFEVEQSCLYIKPLMQKFVEPFQQIHVPVALDTDDGADPLPV